MTKSAILIAGPTASGKSAVALAVAERLGGVIINTDSMQVYKDLNILSARPSAADEARVPHRLYGVLDAAEACSAGRWLELVEKVLAEVEAMEARPIFVGGTGLYFKALTEGLAPIPDVPAAIRASARARYEALGGAAFREALKEVDPASATRLPPGDSQRLIRAWEVAEATGKPLGDWHKETTPPLVPDAALKLVIAPPRDQLYGQCDLRFDAMMQAGALGEVKTLLARGLTPDLPAMRAIGIPPLIDCLQGACDLQEAENKAKTTTRRYAKRQLTWLRRHMISWNSIYKQDSESLINEIFSIIREKGLT